MRFPISKKDQKPSSRLWPPGWLGITQLGQAQTHQKQGPEFSNSNEQNGLLNPATRHTASSVWEICFLGSFLLLTCKPSLIQQVELDFSFCLPFLSSRYSAMFLIAEDHRSLLRNRLVPHSLVSIFIHDSIRSQTATLLTKHFSDIYEDSFHSKIIVANIRK